MATLLSAPAAPPAVDAPLVYYFGSVTPSDNPQLYRHLVERLANVLNLRASTDAKVGPPILRSHLLLAPFSTGSVGCGSWPTCSTCEPAQTPRWVVASCCPSLSTETVTSLSLVPLRQHGYVTLHTRVHWQARPRPDLSAPRTLNMLPAPRASHALHAPHTQACAAGMVINCMGWVKGFGYLPFFKNMLLAACALRAGARSWHGHQ